MWAVTSLGASATRKFMPLATAWIGAGAEELSSPSCRARRGHVRHHRGAQAGKAMDRFARKSAYAFPKPSRREVCAFQPNAESREMSTNFRGAPSGFDVS